MDDEKDEDWTPAVMMLMAGGFTLGMLWYYYPKMSNAAVAGGMICVAILVKVMWGDDIDSRLKKIRTILSNLTAKYFSR